MIQENILKLVKYAKATGLIEKEDEVYTINRLLELFEVDDIEDATFDKINGEGDYTQEQAEEVLEDILAYILAICKINTLKKHLAFVF